MVEGTTFECPQCSSAVVADGKVLMYGCSYNVVGTKATGKSASSGWKHQGDSCRMFDPAAEDTASSTWRVITFLTKLYHEPKKSTVEPKATSKAKSSPTPRVFIRAPCIACGAHVNNGKAANGVVAHAECAANVAAMLRR